MALQIPQEKLGTALGVLIYSFLCLLASFLMIWLLSVHREARSYVALMSYSTALGSGASIAQQIHTIVNWRDVKIEQHRHALENLGNAELIVAGQSYGLDLVLFYLQLYSYNVTALATFFWATALAQSIFQVNFITTLKGKWNDVSKVVAVGLPIITISLLQLDALQRNPVAFLVIADVFLILAVSGSIVTLLIILLKYIDTRRRVLSWHVRYGERTASILSDDTQPDRGKRSRRTIYDSWLVTRFSIAAVTMGVFQLFTVTFQLRSAHSNAQDSLPAEPDLSLERLQGDLLNFMPGVSASLLTFVVFGTTKAFREFLGDKLIPSKIRRFAAPHGAERLGSAPPTPGFPPASFESELHRSQVGTFESIRLSEIHVERHGKIPDVDEWPISRGSAWKQKSAVLTSRGT